MMSTGTKNSFFATTVCVALFCFVRALTSLGTVQNLQVFDTELKDIAESVHSLSVHGTGAGSNNSLPKAKPDDVYVLESKTKAAVRESSLRESTLVTNAGIEFRKPIWSNASSFDNGAPSILVQLNGELANYLGFIAKAFGLVWWLEREYGVNPTIVLRHQQHPKWVGAHADVTRCFPYLRDFNFGAGNTRDISKELSVLSQSHQQNNGTAERVVDIRSEVPYDKTIQSFLSLYAKSHIHIGGEKSRINIPFLTTKQMSCRDLIVDKYYDDIRRIYRFDKSCCVDVPDPDESVFHFRNFVKERSGLRKQPGYEELAPEQVANELFAHLNPGDKVAIISRYPNDFRTQMIVGAFEKRKIRARVVEPRSGVADFCFLMHTQKEMVGTAWSTYFLWAGLLGNATSVRPYTAIVPGRNSQINSHNFTHPDLKSRFRFEHYISNFTAGDLRKPKGEQ